MKRLLIPIAVVGMLPIVAWALSLVVSLATTGNLLAWSPVAYAPLFISTFPLEGLYKAMIKWNHGESHGVVFLFAMLAGFSYALTLIMSPLLVDRFLRQRDLNRTSNQ